MSRTIPTPTIDADGAEVIQGRDLTLRFDGKRCIHARFCVLGAPEVFIANVQGPWIDPDGMDAELLTAIAHRCPSGAITITRRDGHDERPPRVNTAYVRENGPVAITADLHIAGESPRIRATLCRCGASQKKPYCDGSHVAAGFTATGEPATGDTTALEARDGELQVTPLTDGPLQVKGNLEICSGTGRTIRRASQVFLCRCGASNNKPYCDGTHRKVGFKS
jgi:CDGSH-type Zn-finger protein/ferredoxin